MRNNSIVGRSRGAAGRGGATPITARIRLWLQLHRTSRRGMVVLVVSCVIGLVSVTPAGTAAMRATRSTRSGDSRPNILLLVSDDQAWSTFSRSHMPNAYSQIVDHGLLFNRAYVQTPLCRSTRPPI